MPVLSPTWKKTHAYPLKEWSPPTSFATLCSRLQLMSQQNLNRGEVLESEANPDLWLFAFIAYLHKAKI